MYCKIINTLLILHCSNICDGEYLAEVHQSAFNFFVRVARFAVLSRMR